MSNGIWGVVIKCSASKEKAKIMCEAWERKRDWDQGGGKYIERVRERERETETEGWEQNKVRKHSRVHLVTGIVGGRVPRLCFAQ